MKPKWEVHNESCERMFNSDGELIAEICYYDGLWLVTHPAGYSGGRKFKDPRAAKNAVEDHL